MDVQVQSRQQRPTPLLRWDPVTWNLEYRLLEHMSMWRDMQIMHMTPTFRLKFACFILVRVMPFSWYIVSALLINEAILRFFSIDLLVSPDIYRYLSKNKVHLLKQAYIRASICIYSCINGLMKLIDKEYQ